MPATTAPRADEMALEFVKQILTLSSGVLAISSTFIEKFLVSSLISKIILAVSWLFMLVSVYAGINAISAIVKSRLDENDDWSEGKGKSYHKWSKLGFILGIFLFVVFAFLSVIERKNSDIDQENNPNMISISQYTAD